MHGRTISRVVGAVAVAVSWVAASLPLDGGVLDLLPFLGPGALLGLTVGWVSYAFDRRHFHWLTGLRTALAGLVILPPWLALLVALSGLTVASALTVLVLGAWLAIVGGIGAAVIRWLTITTQRLTRVVPRPASGGGRGARRYLPDEDA